MWDPRPFPDKAPEVPGLSLLLACGLAGLIWYPTLFLDHSDSGSSGLRPKGAYQDLQWQRIQENPVFKALWRV